MPIETESVIIDDDSIEEIYAFEYENPEIKKLVYRINEINQEITMYPQEKDFFVSEIILEGFESLPDEFSEKGYMKAGLMYYFNKKLKGKGISKFIISKSQKSSYRKNGNKYKVILNYDDLKMLRKQLTDISNTAKCERSLTVDDFFHKVFPRKFEKENDGARIRMKKVINSLGIDIIEHFGPEELQVLENFYIDLINKKYKSGTYKTKLITKTKIRVDNIALDNIIQEFEKKLHEEPSEDEWGKFIKKNLFLLDSKYIKEISQLNVVLSGTRKADFGLIDSQGYLDIFEIKKSNTKVLSNSVDRGNYYWSTEAAKAIAQVEKYLFHAERKAANLVEDIKREEGITDINVKVIKPRAFIIMGNSSELDTPEKEQDFRILSRALKNIEIVLYDELLERLKNQKNKIYG